MAETNPSAGDDLTVAECVYIGQRLTADHKLGETWLLLDQLAGVKPGATSVTWNEIESGRAVFSVDRKQRSPAVGSIYRMKVRIEAGSITSAATKSREFLRQYDNAEARARWDDIDQAERMRHRALQLEEKIKGTRPLADQLAALRDHYQRIPFADRLAFELLVLSYIRKGR